MIYFFLLSFTSSTFSCTSMFLSFILTFFHSLSSVIFINLFHSYSHFLYLFRYLFVFLFLFLFLNLILVLLQFLLNFFFSMVFHESKTSAQVNLTFSNIILNINHKCRIWGKLISIYEWTDWQKSPKKLLILLTIRLNFFFNYYSIWLGFHS